MNKISLTLIGTVLTAAAAAAGYVLGRLHAEDACAAQMDALEKELDQKWRRKLRAELLECADRMVDRAPAQAPHHDCNQIPGGDSCADDSPWDETKGEPL